MVVAKIKPSFDQFVQAVKANFPPEAQITHADEDNLREVFDSATREQLAEAYRYAQKYSPLTPLSTIYRQLGGDGIYRPTFNEQYHTGDGRRVENGTDWQAIYARMDAERANRRAEYDQTHGAGAFDRAEAEKQKELHNYFIQIEAEPPKLGKDDSVDDYDSWSDEDKKWYDNLVKEVLAG